MKKATLATMVILLPVLVTFLVSYGKNRELVERRLLEDLSIISDGFEGQAYQFIEMARRRAVDFSTDGAIIAALRAGQGSEALSAHLSGNKLPIDGQIHAIAVVSSGGIVLASTDRALMGADFSGNPAFTAAQEKAAVIESGLAGGAPGLAASAPVRGPGGRFIGVVTNFILLSELDGVLTGDIAGRYGAPGEESRPRRTLEAYIVNRDGRVIADSARARDAAPGRLVSTGPVAACVKDGGEVTGFYRGYEGSDVAGSSACMPAVGWTLLVEMDANEALEPVRAIGRNAVGAAVAVALLISCLLLLFYKTVVAQLRVISRAAVRVSEGDYGQSVPVSGADEISSLSASFNRMVEQIRERSAALSESEERLKSILDNAFAIVYLKDTGGRYIFVNTGFAALFRVGRHSFAGRTDDELLPAPVAAAFREEDAEVLRTLSPISFETTLPIGGAERTYISVKFPLVGPQGRPYAVCGFLTDITERKATEQALRVTQERLNRAQQITMTGCWDWDIPGKSLWWSDEIYRMFGIDAGKSKATYESFLKAVHPDDREVVEYAVHQAFYGGKPYSIDHRIVMPNGEVKVVHEEADIVLGESGRPLRMLGTVQDVTEKRRAEFELRKLSAAIEQSVNLVFITNRHGVIEYVNPTFEQVTGYTAEEAVGQTPRILSSGEVSNALYQELWTTILSGRTWRTTIKNRRKTGGHYWANTVITPIRDDRGQVTHFLAVQEDVTEKMVSEERINYLANFDELTGFINRSRFIELVEEWINMSSLREGRGVLCLADMDQFKLLNDTYGHGLGDEYMRRLARVLDKTVKEVRRKCAASSDAEPLISRLSGDEFAVYFPGMTGADGMQAAEDIRKAVEGFYFTEASSAFTVSIGLVTYPEQGTNVRDLLTRADAAMYRAKELGRNRVHAYRDEDHDLERMHSRLAWREKIMKGLREGRFVPWFQPILDLSTGTVHHFEALARLEDEDGSIVLPGAFIDIAERFGIIGLIDRIIIEKAMLAQAGMMGEGKAVSFGMNLSGKDLGDPELLDFIRTKIGETGADPRYLVFEITETATISDLGAATSFVRALKELGCKFSLDDFGVGFTSFTYLKELQVDFIKIDGSFIKRLEESPNDQVLVKAMASLAKGLGIKSIAEFVENGESLELLKSFGVDFAQGYLIGKPGPGLGPAGQPAGPPAGRKKKTVS